MTPKELNRNADVFIAAATHVSKAESSEAFFDALRQGYLTLHASLTQDESGDQVKALRRAFGRTQSDPGVHMALELCALPIYEKPILPPEPALPPEFLWLFTLPVVITFPAEFCREGPFVWPESPLPAETLLSLLEASGRVDERAALRMFTNLYTRSDILSWGPENLARHVVDSELSDAECPVALPVQFSAELGAYRSVMFFALCAARVPIGIKSLLRPLPGRNDLVEVERAISAQLAILNIPHESVTVAPPCPVTSTCFVSNPSFLQQVAEICQASQDLWDLKSAHVKFPMPGYVEIVGRLEGAGEVVLMPAELCCEPQAAVSATLERVMRNAGLNVGAALANTLAPACHVH